MPSLTPKRSYFRRPGIIQLASELAMNPLSATLSAAKTMRWIVAKQKMRNGGQNSGHGERKEMKALARKHGIHKLKKGEEVRKLRNRDILLVVPIFQSMPEVEEPEDD